MDHTQKIFERSDIASYYAGYTRLTQAEMTVFEKYKGAYAGKRVLDLGVGGGRTTHFLAPYASLYIGIDYSRAMIEICQDRYPHYQFEPGDARDLSRFPACCFDFVLFSYNGIDFVDHAGRLQVLREVARVLVPGGLFVFSTHSLEWALKNALWQSIRNFRPSTGRLSVPKRWGRIGLRMLNYMTHRHRQIKTKDYAILLDPGHDFIVPIYNLNAAEQERQLQVAGFKVTPQVISEASTEDSVGEQSPYSMYYIASKP